MKRNVIMALTIITWVSLVVIPISVIVAIGNGGNENTYGWFVAACASFISFIVYGSLVFIVKSMNGESPSFERKHLFKFATMFIAVIMGLAMSSCSKDDDDGGGNSGAGSSDNYSQYVGKWSGSAKSSTGGTWGLIVQFYANKTADFNLFFIGGGSVNTVEKTTGKKVVYYDDSKTIYVHSEGDLYNVLRVVSISGNNMVLDFIDYTFNMERTPGSGGSGGNSDSGGSSGGSGKRCTLCGGSGSCSNVNDNQDHYCHGSKKCGWCNGGIIYWAGTERVCDHCNGKDKCQYCNGTGKCSRCGGDGWM